MHSTAKPINPSSDRAAVFAPGLVFFERLLLEVSETHFENTHNQFVSLWWVIFMLDDVSGSLLPGVTATGQRDFCSLRIPHSLNIRRLFYW